MGYAIFHGSKGKGSGGGLGYHIDRTEGKEYTYQHSDPERKHLNHNFPVYQGRDKLPLNQAIKERISEGYNGKRAIRNDAVKYMTQVYTGSHERMKEIFADKELKAKWLDENKKFAAEEFGAKNIVRFTLHLDEKTPHLHAVVVPLTSDGRLSAKEIMGNKKAMQLRQDRYAEAMKPFGLERGIKGTAIKHENASDYYKRISEAQKNASQSELEPVKGLLGINKDKTIKKYQSALKSSNLALREVQGKLEKSEIKVKSTVHVRNENVMIRRNVSRMMKENKEKDREIKKVREDAVEIIMNPIKTQEVREAIKAKEQEKGKDKGWSR